MAGLAQFETPEWMDEAACKGEDQSIFFVERRVGEDSAAKVRAARRICIACPVRVDCLEYALTFPDRQLIGIWGGKTMEERQRIRRDRRR